MQLGNPLPVLLGISLMGCLCWLLARWLPVLEPTAAHAKTLPLDGLRGILAASVFFHHAYITYGLFHTGKWARPISNFYAEIGPTAVMLFFFISGYLFWGKMLRNPESLRYATLLPNRLRRIMPAYLGAILVFFFLAMFSTGFQVRVPIPKLCFEVVSWILGGFPVFGGMDFNSVEPLFITGGMFWTLQLEWLFYLLLPLLAWFRSIPRLLLLAVFWQGVYFLFLLLRHIPYHGYYVSNILYTAMRFASMFPKGFAVGMLAAYRIPSERVNQILRSPWATPIALLLMGAHLFLIPPTFPFHEAPPWCLVPVFFMIVAGNSFWGLLSSLPLRCLGAVSYSVYIFHGMILRVLTLTLDRYFPVRLMTPLHYWLWVLAISVVVAVWASISYCYIEKPFFARRALA